MRTHAVIIGAGLSGLAAADVLRAASKSFVVLEEQSRVGGRMLSVTMGGHTVDAGAQWLGPQHKRLLSLARRFEMETQLQYAEGNSIVCLDGRTMEYAGETPKLPALAAMERGLLLRRWRAESAAVPAGAPWRPSNAQAWDSQTLESWIAKNLSTEASREFARVQARITLGANPEQISYLWTLAMMRDMGALEGLLRVQGGPFDATFKGGAQLLPQRMAQFLGYGLVSPVKVRAVTQDDKGVVVRTEAAQFEAGYVIAAISPSLCSKIAFEGVSARRSALCQHMTASPAIKVLVAYREPFWRSHGYSGRALADRGPLGFVMDHAAGDIAFLTGLIVGPQVLAMAEMPAPARRNAVIGQLVDLFGEEAAAPLEYLEKDWDAASGGFMPMMSPGLLTSYGDALRTPCGRVHWAGAETASEWIGTMEGAIESGERAAREVLARLDA